MRSNSEDNMEQVRKTFSLGEVVTIAIVLVQFAVSIGVYQYRVSESEQRIDRLERVAEQFMERTIRLETKLDILMDERGR